MAQYRKRWGGNGDTYCAKCRDERVVAWRRAPENKEAMRKNYRASKLRRYGLNEADVLRLITKQGGGCAICGGVEWGSRGPNVDHCHEGGHVRGILCMTCNIGIGHFKDDPELLMSAASYLLFRANRGEKS